MQPVPPSVDLRAEHAQALCLVSLSPVQAARVASVLLSIPFEVAAHAYSQGHILLGFGIIKEPFRGLFDAMKHMVKASGGLRKLVSTARSLKFARAAFSPTQPIIFTFKDMYQRMWTPPLNPLYVPPASDDVWIQWMVPHFASGGLAGLTYSVMIQVGSRFNPATLKDRAFLGARLPVAVATGRPLPNPGMPLPNQAWVTIIPFTLHRLVYHGTYDSLAPRNPLGAVALGLAVSTVASAVADGVHHMVRASAGLPTLDRTGFAATAKARLVRSIPGGLALALFDQSRRIYCIGKTTLTE